MNPWQANALKYLLRYNDKGKPLEDLKKLQHYVNYLINIEDKQNVQNSHQGEAATTPKDGFPHL